ncbi:GspE/PulE family protein [Marinoscillum sp. 108]|uniref:GspE/PulE family protein n=1 Tax=Marinoscillum sp. 108 TaxID=2653151 RepID=UPI0012EF2850|nr:GspE/PulE family protein [Marinoscillum sp. 108]VXD14816.1 General secretion pathway protein GspE [Marinoscillum sp. 108]
MLDQSAPISSNLIKELSTSIAWKYRVFPKMAEGRRLVLYADAQEPEMLARQLSVITGKEIHIEVADSEWIGSQLTRYYIRSGGDTVRSLNVNSDEFIGEMISEANELGCSDIHIEKYQDRSRIRMRLDGKLIERYELKKEKYHEYVNKIKIISNLDIAEKRLPQDGRILIKNAKGQYDIRVSVLPTLFGEKVVLRLLSSDASNLDIRQLGLNAGQIKLFLESISRPQGMVLISGPTGSGKTTTLYGALKYLNVPTTNILTIEDPIEYTLDGINQVQLNEKVGLDFATTLRTFLRQDPDIIMVGEIRDVDTARIAIRAAMTGHLVMSTLHTNSAIGIISRLMEMGIPEYLIADTLNVAVAQRLLRRLCPACKHRQSDLSQLPEILKNSQIDCYFTPVGCSECHGTGYKGRMAIYEMVNITETNKELIFSKPDQYSSENGSLMTSAIEQFEQGETSLEEIYTYLL